MERKACSGLHCLGTNGIDSRCPAKQTADSPKDAAGPEGSVLQPSDVWSPSSKLLGASFKSAERSGLQRKSMVGPPTKVVGRPKGENTVVDNIYGLEILRSSGRITET